MKIEFDNDMLIIYLYKTKLILEDLTKLNKDIKNILLKITNQYKVNFSGIYEVIIYENIYYGDVLEIKKIKEFEYGDFIDLKIEIRRNQNFYLVFKNYYFIEEILEFFYKNDLFYVKINETIDINKKIEFADIFYKDDSFLVNKIVRIK